MQKKVKRIKVIEISSYIGIYILGLVASLILFATNNELYYIYSYLFCSIFILGSIFWLMYLTNKYINFFISKKTKLSKKLKTQFIFMNCFKYIPLFFFIILGIISIEFKIWLINSYVVLISAIITFIIVFLSEIFKYYRLKISLNSNQTERRLMCGKSK